MDKPIYDTNISAEEFEELRRETLNNELERTKIKRFFRYFRQNWLLFVMLLPLILYYYFLHYRPMGGILIGFKKFEGSGTLQTTLNAQWYGFYAFKEIMFGSNALRFWQAFRNTFSVSMYGLIFGFPIPILLALFFSEIKNTFLRSMAQIISYLPKFISTVVITSLLILMLAPGDAGLVKPGILNQVMVFFGAVEPNTNILAQPAFFRSIYVISGIWESAGYGSIVYFAAIMAISPTNYEAARIDGASKLNQIRYVTLPGMAPTLVVMIILQIGGIMSVGYEKILLMVENGGQYVLQSAEVISLYVLKMGGLVSVETGSGINIDPTTSRGIAVAADLFNGIIAMFLVIGTNFISRRVSDTSLF